MTRHCVATPGTVLAPGEKSPLLFDAPRNLSDVDLKRMYLPSSATDFSAPAAQLHIVQLCDELSKRTDLVRQDLL